MGQCARTASDIEANIYLSYLASLQTYICSAGTLDTQSQMEDWFKESNQPQLKEVDIFA